MLQVIFKGDSESARIFFFGAHVTLLLNYFDKDENTRKPYHWLKKKKFLQIRNPRRKLPPEGAVQRVSNSVAWLGEEKGGNRGKKILSDSLSKIIPRGTLLMRFIKWVTKERS